MTRPCNAKIVATLGPASADRTTIAALRPGAELLLDDGRLRRRVEASGPDCTATRVIAGGLLSDRKGVNVPGVVLPLSALTDKDRADLDFGLALGVDWVALSFVQRAADIVEARP
jgi:pyruvate kinase